MNETYQIQHPDVKRDYVRVKALGVMRRGEQILVEQIREPDGTLVGYRPLGGSVEFGEKSWEAVEREFMEELGEDIKITGLVGVLENIFTYDGKPGHEVVFLYEGDFLNKQIYSEDVVERVDITTDDLLMKTAHWLDPFNLPEGLPLFPEGLVEKLKQ